MTIVKWIVPGLAGIAIGVAATVAVGSMAGLVSSAAAEKMASEKAAVAVVAALTPICIAQSRSDPDSEAKIAQLKAVGWYGRSKLIMQDGWATMPGSAEPDAAVANACAEKLGV